ncbi:MULTISPECIES: hypothetical protein [unclassified Vibrio]|nr:MULTISPECIES: hypothetical protein [unclassified Vibrio]
MQKKFGGQGVLHKASGEIKKAEPLLHGSAYFIGLNRMTVNSQLD